MYVLAPSKPSGYLFDILSGEAALPRGRFTGQQHVIAADSLMPSFAQRPLSGQVPYEAAYGEPNAPTEDILQEKQLEISQDG